MEVKEGVLAKDFCLMSDAGEEISLERLKGNKVVLYFYPKDNTPGCTNEAKDFSDKLKEFNDLGVVVIGASKDSMKSHASFKKKYNLNIMLISDESGKLFEDYCSWVEKSMFARKYMSISRDTFLIDEDRKIIKIWRKVRVKGHAQQVLEFINNY